MNSETLMKHNMHALGEIIKELGNEKDYENYISQLQNWEALWEILKKKLKEISFTDRDTTILYMAEHYLPNFQSIRPFLELSLSIHDDFWNEFYLNMLRAKVLG